jgi:hypothetical protein
MAEARVHLECIRVVVGMLQQIGDYIAEDRYMDVHDIVVSARRDLESITWLAFRVEARSDPPHEPTLTRPI